MCGNAAHCYFCLYQIFYMKNSPVILFLLIALCFTITSCGPNYILDTEYSLDNESWNYDNPLIFETEIADTSLIYNIYLDLEHSPEFSMQNLYVQIRTAFPNGNKNSELVSLELANKAGQWFGRCNEKSCKLRIPLQEGAYFNALGKHQFTLEQYTRKAALPAVQSIAMRIEQTDKSRSSN